MYELALFAGAGGGLLASKLLGWRTICYVEWNAYAVEVLKARIGDGYLDDAPIWDDCFSFDGTPWIGLVDIVTAGFPCQPFSQAGKGLAENDRRNGWLAVKRIIGEVRPNFAFLENVPGLISKPYIRRIFGDLAEIGYDAEWGTLSAAAIGAPHIRERIWIVAYAVERQGAMAKQSWSESIYAARNGEDGILADPEYNPILHNQQHNQTNTILNRIDWWTIEPELGRVADGVAHRMDRLKTIGNGQVPEVARTAWKLLRSRR